MPDHKARRVLRRNKRLRGPVSPTSALLTASVSGTVSNSATFGGTAFTNGDRIVRAAGVTLTFDVSVTLGDSRPHRTVAVPSVAVTGGGSSGGSLPAGTYTCLVVRVDSGGLESAVSPRSAGFTVAAGNIPRVTVPAVGAGASTLTLYLTNTNDSAGTTRRYAVGITATTVDLSLGTWLDAGGSAVAAASAVAEPAGFALDAGTTGDVVIASGVTVKVRGDVTRSCNLTLDGTAVLEWDASASVGTTNTKYADYAGTSSFGQTNIRLRTTNTNKTTARATIRSNAGGGNGYFRNGVGNGLAGPHLDTTNFDLGFVDFQRVGDAANDCLQVVPSSGTTFATAINGCTFDAGSGRVNVGGVLASSYAVTNNTMRQTGPANCARYASAGGGIPTGTKTVSGNVHARAAGPPLLGANGVTYGANNSFLNGYALDAGASQQPWLGFTDAFVRLTVLASQALFENGATNRVVHFYDARSAALRSGSVGSATATAVTAADTSGWTANQYQSTGSGVEYDLIVTNPAGTVSVSRQITANTNAGVLTVAPAWTAGGGPQPDATWTYQVRQTVCNAHFTQPAGLTGNGGSVTSGTSGSVFFDNTQTSAKNTTTTAAGTNATVIPVASTAGYQVGDLLYLPLPRGGLDVATHRVVTAVNAGANTITVNARVSFSSGDSVRKGPAGACWTAQLAGSYANYNLTFDTGANAGLTRTVSAINPATGQLTTATAFPNTPAAGDVYRIWLPYNKTDCWFGTSSCSAEGDVWQNLNGHFLQHLMTGCVGGPCGNKLDNAGVLFVTSNSIPGTFTLRTNHNAGVTGSQCLFSMNEIGTATQNMPEGVWLECLSNLGVQPLAAGAYPTGPFGGSGSSYLVNSLGSISASGARDIIPGSAVNFNAIQNPNNGYNKTTNGFSAPGYNTNTSAATGANDLTAAMAADGGPRLADPYRSVDDFGRSRGKTGDMFAVLDAVYAEMEKRNDPTGYDAAYEPAAILDWLRAGWVTSSTVLRNAGHDGVTVGAMGFQAAGPAKGVYALNHRRRRVA